MEWDPSVTGQLLGTWFELLAVSLNLPGGSFDQHAIIDVFMVVTMYHSQELWNDILSTLSDKHVKFMYIYL